MHIETNLAFIPIKTFSRRLTRKNFRKVFEKPMYEWTVNAAIRSKVFDSIVISTDSDLLIEKYNDNDDVIVAERKGEALREDLTIDKVIEHQWDLIRSSETITVLQVTSPLRTSSHIRKAFKMFSNQDRHEPLPLYSVNISSPDKPNGAIRIYQTQRFFADIENIELNGLNESNSIKYIMSDIDGFDIDTEIDLLNADFLMRFKFGENIR